MSIGLDLTTLSFSSIRPGEGQLASRGCRACFVAVEKSPLHRHLLDQLQLAYAECDNRLLVWGEHASSFSKIFLAQSPCLPLLPQGQLPENQPPVRQMLAYLIEGLLPKSEGNGEICGVAFPRSHESLRQSTTDFLTQLINLSGYRVAAISPSRAMALAEFAACEYTGIALHIGAFVSDMCVMHHGRVLWHQSVELSACLPASLWGEFQSSLVSPRSEALTERAHGPVGSHREKLEADASREPTEFAADVIMRCRVLQQVMECHFTGLAAASIFQSSSRPVPLLLGGECPRGSAVAQGMQQDMAALGGPLPIGEVRWPMFGEQSVARGCLIHAELESQADGSTRAA
ncbi:MAG: hypothetical protein ACKVT0_02585 [Planctomycetaceae bacterium]